LVETLVDSVVDEAIYQVKDLAQSRQMRLLQAFDDEPQFVMADQRLLTRMLVNLLVNAVRYGQHGSDIHITLSHDPETLAPQAAGQAAPTGQMVHIVMQNTVGAPDDANRPRHMASQGFGLGLSFVKTVVRKHQGHIHLHLPTEPGATAEVRLQLPMAKPCWQT
jgi:signal transduction histidine kinase